MPLQRLLNEHQAAARRTRLRLLRDRDKHPARADRMIAAAHAKQVYLAPQRRERREREALDYIRAGLPDCEPYRAWTNFEFMGDDGSINEVDALVLTPKGLFFVECKGHPGEISGDSGTWTWRTPEGRAKVFDNPLLLANRKVRKLASLLRRQKALRKERLPFVKALVFLSAKNLVVKLPEHARQGICVRDREDHPGAKQGPIQGILHALKYVTPKEYQRRGYKAINTPQAKAISRAMEQAGIRRSQKALRVGDYLLLEGPGYQDFQAKHVSLKNVKRRVRVFRIGRRPSSAFQSTPG